MADGRSCVTWPPMSATCKRSGERLSSLLSSSSAALLVSLLLASTGQAQWQADRGVVIAWTVVTMNDADDVLPNARVFIRDGTIVAVARDGEDLPASAADAIVVTTDGLVYPGLIDLHNHPE